jgi:hypothetical protein
MKYRDCNVIGFAEVYLCSHEMNVSTVFNLARS